MDLSFLHTRPFIEGFYVFAFFEIPLNRGHQTVFKKEKISFFQKNTPGASWRLALLFHYTYTKMIDLRERPPTPRTRTHDAKRNGFPVGADGAFTPPTSDIIIYRAGAVRRGGRRT